MGGGGLYRNAAAISSGANAQSVPAAKEKSLPACDERYRKKERKKERKGTKRKATRPSETHRRSSQPQSGQSRRLSGNQSRNRSIRLLTLSLSLCSALFLSLRLLLLLLLLRSHLPFVVVVVVVPITQVAIVGLAYLLSLSSHSFFPLFLSLLFFFSVGRFFCLRWLVSLLLLLLLLFLISTRFSLFFGGGLFFFLFFFFSFFFGDAKRW